LKSAICFQDMLRDIKNDMWYLGFTLRESKDKLIHFIRYGTVKAGNFVIGV
jgi:hypothetical protein